MDKKPPEKEVLEKLKGRLSEEQLKKVAGGYFSSCLVWIENHYYYESNNLPCEAFKYHSGKEDEDPSCHSCFHWYPNAK